MNGMNKKCNRNKLFALCMSLMLVFSMLFTTAGFIQNVQAVEGLSSYKKVTFYKANKVGSTTYLMKYNDKTKRYSICAQKNGRNRVLVSNCISGTVVTNGKYLYYEKGTFTRGGAFGASYENRKIVCLTIRNKSVKGIVNYQSVGKAHSIIGCDGRYLYMGEQTQYGDGFNGFTVYDLKSKQMNQVGTSCSTVQAVKDKVLVTTVGVPHGGPVYLVEKDGSGRKYITQRAISVKVKGNYIYYTEATYDWQTRKCRCDLNGDNQKALTEWSAQYK